jgi:hypothetical protein
MQAGGSVVSPLLDNFLTIQGDVLGIVGIVLLIHYLRRAY